MAKYIYVHHTNLLVEGRRLRAFKKGHSSLGGPNTPQSFDNTYYIHLTKLTELLTGGKNIDQGRSALFGSNNPPLESFWAAAKRLGWRTFPENRIIGAMREERLDAWMTAVILKDACEIIDPEVDEIVIVSGDSDLVPVVRLLRQDGFRVNVVFWNHASMELKMAASSFTPLDDHLESLAFTPKPKSPEVHSTAGGGTL
jgi:hypothetical protein